MFVGYGCKSEKYMSKKKYLMINYPCVPANSRPVPELEDMLAVFEAHPPEVVFEWYDKETTARGYLVINSLRGGAAGGGTRLYKGITKAEVLSLAKTMEVKFSVTGPAIGGGKSGIDFDPADPRKQDVLQRWFAAITPLLQCYYGTGGDFNVDEMTEVIPITARYDIRHPQQGIVAGYFGKKAGDQKNRINRLRQGVSQLVEDKAYTPVVGRYAVADLITGYGVFEAIRHYYRLWGGTLRGKRAIIQGWGNVAAAAAFYLSQQGVRIVGIIDRVGGLLAEEGLSKETVRKLFLSRKKSTLCVDNLIPFDEVQESIWDVSADIFVPAAASRLVTTEQCARMIDAGLTVIACGANLPFQETTTFYGETTQYVDDNVSLLPDFIASGAMARVFAYLMGENTTGSVDVSSVFVDCSACMAAALENIQPYTPAGKHIARVGLYKALQQVV